MENDSFWGNIFRKEKQGKKTVIDCLKEVPLFGNLNHSELEAVVKITHLRQYKKGETVFYQGDPGVGMYIIESGKVGIILKHQPAVDLRDSHVQRGRASQKEVRKTGGVIPQQDRILTGRPPVLICRRRAKGDDRQIDAERALSRVDFRVSAVSKPLWPIDPRGEATVRKLEIAVLTVVLKVKIGIL